MKLNSTIIGQAISFIFFVFFCMKYIWPDLINLIENRQKEIADGIAATKLAKKELSITLSKIDNKFKETKIKVQKIIEQANKQKNKILNEAKDEAKKERNRIIINAKKEINNERKKVQEELHKNMVNLVLLGIEKITENIIDESMHKDIIEKSIVKLLKEKN